MKLEEILKKKSKLLEILYVVAISVTFFAICATSIQYKSHSRDEGRHLVRGIMLLETGDYRLNKHHPVLANALNAIPQLVNDKVVVPGTDNEYWERADKDKLEVRLVRINGGKRQFAENVLNKSRYVTALALAISIPIIYYLTKKHWGIAAAAVVTFLYAFSPNIIAHSRLVTTDAWVVPIGFAGTIALYDYIKNKTTKNLFVFAVVSVTGLLLKYSMVPVAGFWIIFLSFFEFLSFRSKKTGFIKSILKSLCKPLIVILIWTFILFAAYGFRFATLQSTNHANTHKTQSHIESLEEFAEDKHIPADAVKKLYLDIPWPFPEYIQGFFENVLLHDKYGHDSFLYGQYAKTGWWYYFPAAMLVKTPVPVIIGFFSICAWGIYWLVNHTKEMLKSFKKLANTLFGRLKKWFGIHSKPKPAIIFIAIPALYMLISMKSSINLGVRHVLVVMPFLYLGIGLLVAKLWELKGNAAVVIRSLAAVFALWYLASAIYIYPHYLEYFNELIGGPSNGYKYLLDSNLSWAQDDLYVEDYINMLEEKYPETPVYRNPEEEIERGYVVIDVDYMMGRDRNKRERTAWIREPLLAGKIEPIDRINYTYMVFEF